MNEEGHLNFQTDDFIIAKEFVENEEKKSWLFGENIGNKRKSLFSKLSTPHFENNPQITTDIQHW